MSEPMTPAEYRAFVVSMLTYPGALSYERCAIGAATEAAEALAYVAKVRWQGHGFDRETLANELGDVLFYLSGIDASIGGTGEYGDEWDAPLPYAYEDFSDLGAVRALFRAVFEVEAQPQGTIGDRALDAAWGHLAYAAERNGYSLADLAALNVAKLRDRYAATGGQFDAGTSAGRGAE